MVVHFQVIANAVLYFVAFLTGLLATASLVVMKVNLGGRCLLYLGMPWNNTTTSLSLALGSDASCSFSLYLPLFSSMYAFLMAVYYSYNAIAAMRERRVGHTIWLTPWLVLNCLFMLLTFLCACTFTIGLYRTCSQLEKAVKDVDDQSDCQKLLTNVYWDSVSEVFSVTTYNAMSIAQYSLWSSLVCWVLLVGLLGVQVSINRRARAPGFYDDLASSETKGITDIASTA